MKKTFTIKVCPECYNHKFIFDSRHKELYCFKCGLVLKAPRSEDFTTPDKLENMNIDINVPSGVKVINVILT